MAQALQVHGYQLWRDRRGRISYLRIAALAPCCWCRWLLALLRAWWASQLAPRLLNDLVHRTGYWALLFVLISLGDHAAAAERALRQA